jgi:hypothetical protein
MNFQFEVTYAILREANGNYSVPGLNNLKTVVTAPSSNQAREMVQAQNGGADRVTVSSVWQIF